MNRPYRLLVLVALMSAGGMATADDPASTPTPTKHQMMKECMAKQKASDGGQPKEQMKQSCKDLTETEHDNAKAEKKEEAAEQSAAPAHE